MSMRRFRCRGQPSVAGSRFAPQTIRHTRSPAAGRTTPDRSAASGSAAAGSTASLNSRHMKRCASRIASSVSSAVCAMWRCEISHAIAPMRRAPSESAAMPPTATSTGAPAARALNSVSAAEAQAGGKASKAEFASERGALVYEVEIVTADSKVFDVKVDATNGKVLSSKLDQADRGEKEDNDD